MFIVIFKRQFGILWQNFSELFGVGRKNLERFWDQGAEKYEVHSTCHIYRVFRDSGGSKIPSPAKICQREKYIPGTLRQGGASNRSSINPCGIEMAVSQILDGHNPSPVLSPPNRAGICDETGFFTWTGVSEKTGEVMKRMQSDSGTQ